MIHISIISASVRTGRESHKVARYLKKYLEEKNIASAEILDLKEYNFPLFEERLKNQATPDIKALDFATTIKSSDGIIMVTPEYNGGYPASLKNVIDLLYEQWHRKPIGISTVSSGAFGGAQVLTSLQFSLWKIKAWVSTTPFMVPKVYEAFDEDGHARDEAATDKKAEEFFKDLLWCIEANKRMSQD